MIWDESWFHYYTVKFGQEFRTKDVWQIFSFSTGESHPTIARPEVELLIRSIIPEDMKLNIKYQSWT